jgi:glycosyltransferase involved in cell wall biosynthesis
MQKYFYLLVGTLFALSCMALADAPPRQEKKRVCLNMIVKNETSVIRRCLATCKPLIDYWVIVDTGSTDGTQKMIQEFMKDIPGELHESPFKNFEYSRNEALSWAKGKADYIMFMDADDYITYDNGFSLPPLDKDSYQMMIKRGTILYGFTFLVKDALDWKYVGVLHEALVSNQARTSAIINGATIIATTEGDRSKNPKKYENDAKVLEEALKREPNNSRYRFYLGQSYRDGGNYEKALENYKIRAGMGGWEEEVYFSLFRVAELQEALKTDANTIIDSYLKAYTYRPQRQEALFGLVRWYSINHRFEEGYQLAKKGIGAPIPKDVLFIDYTIHDWRLLLEYSVCAYWTERYEEAKLASLWLLSNPKLDTETHQLVERNMQWISSKLQEEEKARIRG